MDVGPERDRQAPGAPALSTAVAIVTGSGGLVGSEAARHLIHQGFDAVGIENDMRAHYFGPGASTAPVTEELERSFAEFHHVDLDVRDAAGVERVFRRHRARIGVVIHAAAQPSHDWAARDPQTDFAVNATGTLNLLEATRAHAPEAPFVFCSTNKVYGDRPNHLPLEEHRTRLDLPPSHPYHEGIDTAMPIDAALHSLFGASKAAADLLVQEYGRYFAIPTACFRAGCITGPGHAGAQLHGFLAYLMKCVVTGAPYTVFGYGGKQVRDNIHATDLAAAFEEYRRAPRAAAVYNIGGGRGSDCSVREAIEASERIAGRELAWELSEQARVGDHRWWISDLAGFRDHYPSWAPGYGVEAILTEIYERNAERWLAAAS